MRMSRMTGAALASALLVGGCADTPLSPAGPANVLSSSDGSATSYSGWATVIDATVLGQQVKLVEVKIPETGGAEADKLLSADLPNGLGTAQVLHASTIAQGNESNSEATVANLDLVVGGNTISASFLRTEARAVCSNGRPSQTGDSDIANLVINGERITVGAEPNQRIELLNGTHIIINEQDNQTIGNHGAITVNALHVVVVDPLTGATLADVIIASAHADIACRTTPPCPEFNDFVTGGGWVDQVGGARRTFAVAGGFKNGRLWGHLVFQNHATGLKVKATEITGYGPATGAILQEYPNARLITGWAEMNGQAPQPFEAIVADVAEPGRGRDFFHLIVGGDLALDVLDGGNIQLHGKGCAK